MSGGIEVHRMALFMHLREQRWPERYAALTVMAVHPFDDVAPRSRKLEKLVRRRSTDVAGAIGRNVGPDRGSQLAVEALNDYVGWASDHGDRLYSERWNGAIERFREGGQRPADSSSAEPDGAPPTPSSQVTPARPTTPAPSRSELYRALADELEADLAAREAADGYLHDLTVGEDRLRELTSLDDSLPISEFLVRVGTVRALQVTTDLVANEPRLAEVREVFDMFAYVAFRAGVILACEVHDRSPTAPSDIPTNRIAVPMIRYAIEEFDADDAAGSCEGHCPAVDAVAERLYLLLLNHVAERGLDDDTTGAWIVLTIDRALGAGLQSIIGQPEL